MTDPFPELPRRVLYVDVKKPAVTKRREPNGFLDDPAIPWCSSDQDVTKPKDATKPVQRNATKVEDATKLGRPAKGDKPMTSTERSRLRRAKKKGS